MYHRQYKITPSQQAADGALDMFVDGYNTHNIQEQLVGLTVLSSATEGQVNTAMVFVQKTRGTSVAEIQAMLQS
jgi:hypothetical protein